MPAPSYAPQAEPDDDELPEQLADPGDDDDAEPEDDD